MPPDAEAFSLRLLELPSSCRQGTEQQLAEVYITADGASIEHNIIYIYLI